jgi:hypothetical protein
VSKKKKKVAQLDPTAMDMSKQTGCFVQMKEKIGSANQRGQS